MTGEEEAQDGEQKVPDWPVLYFIIGAQDFICCHTGGLPEEMCAVCIKY